MVSFEIMANKNFTNLNNTTGSDGLTGSKLSPSFAAPLT
jgi:hypothetical protein